MDFSVEAEMSSFKKFMQQLDGQLPLVEKIVADLQKNNEQILRDLSDSLKKEDETEKLKNDLISARKEITASHTHLENSIKELEVSTSRRREMMNKPN